MEVVNDRAHLEGGCTVDRVEQEGEWCEIPRGNILNVAADTMSICCISQCWWYANSKERRTMVRRTICRGRNLGEATRAIGEHQKLNLKS